ncbi:MAG TPA: hypothetical protein VGD78_04540 [Chthoniobacterales bacterium]
MEPKLSPASPATWVAGVTLTAPEAEEALRLLPEGPLRTRLAKMLREAHERADDLNRLDRSDDEALSELARWQQAMGARRIP